MKPDDSSELATCQSKGSLHRACWPLPELNLLRHITRKCCYKSYKQMLPGDSLPTDPFLWRGHLTLPVTRFPNLGLWNEPQLPSYMDGWGVSIFLLRKSCVATTCNLFFPLTLNSALLCTSWLIRPKPPKVVTERLLFEEGSAPGLYNIGLRIMSWLFAKMAEENLQDCVTRQQDGVSTSAQACTDAANAPHRIKIRRRRQRSKLALEEWTNIPSYLKDNE